MEALKLYEIVGNNFIAQSDSIQDISFYRFDGH